ncbi:D-hexose-6-phosphate mutarotase [Alteromonas lipolytica]|uniref:Putative glucose-6-phosphate 1-epimerase n=1 Tax=Alteromonas lipolytica TaxID=1856405 RepID=A0A1E8FHG9_9ALTE|nr:D-hexose-6-phosphate mutarotase [Alteromonas lipolytica]OFI35359.1 D-hexose-6-phosphate mutarotase [Alteromonas lipolytica]GGF55815.1 D-hexose-6-phosphate mutarotase [Alteromonas lipolytica]
MNDHTYHVEEKDGNRFVTITNSSATCRLSLFGGHILSYIPARDNRDRLWLSPLAVLNGDRPIRGGIPLCWPWFSDDHGKAKGELPSHGFLRTQMWSIEQYECDGALSEMVLVPKTTKGPGFDFNCKVKLVVKVGNTLSVSLVTENLEDEKAFKINCALHTYFEVSNIHHVKLCGMSGNYKDKLDNWAVKPTPVPYEFSSETDRIHLEAPSSLTIEENQQAITSIGSQGHDSIVVWNPWQAAASMSDMDAFGFKQMLCVETALTKGLMLQPRQSHSLTQIIE